MAEENASPISAAKPPAVNPLGSSTAAHASTLKLKPVIRKPVIGGGAKKPTLPAAAPRPAAPAASEAKAAGAAPEGGAMEKLKGVTQKLKGVTQQIPQQAILRKTGIIADQSLTDAQKQASKSRTARISLSDAIGVAPVKEEAAPMKTIRIKRPVDLAPPAAAPKDEPKADDASLTQRKTLKIARPGASAVKPTGKFGLKKPGAPAPQKAPAPAPAAEGDVPEIADIADIPPAAPAPAAAPAMPSNRIPDVPKGLAIFDLLLQIAACAAIGFLAYLLYVDLERDWLGDPPPVEAEA